MPDLTSLEPLEPLPIPAERVRLREAFGVTRTALAESLRVTRKTIYTWETGKGEPTGSNRAEYAAILSAWTDTLNRRGCNGTARRK